MTLNAEIESLLHECGAEIIRFIDISPLPKEDTLGFAKAVVFLIPLSKKFVTDIKQGINTERDEFVDMEHKTDELADTVAEYLKSKGYGVYSQSEKSNEQHGRYDAETMASTLPHKTIARLAGLGFIGRNNLLIHKDFGCAFSMCTVLTDAPLITEKYAYVDNECGECGVCVSVCPSGALSGGTWSIEGGRESVFDVTKCCCPLKCMVHCPRSLIYAEGV